jgi:hypothetical protein
MYATRAVAQLKEEKEAKEKSYLLKVTPVPQHGVQPAPSQPDSTTS